MNKILNTTSGFDAAGKGLQERLSALGLELVRNPFKRTLREEEVIDLMREHRPIGMLAGVEPLTATALSAGQPDLKVIARVGTGWDSVDRKAAAELGIIVSRTADAPAGAVRELAVGLMLAVLRHIAEADRGIRAGQWRKIMGNLLSEKTVGIVGLGKIGVGVARTVSLGFGARIMAYDPFVKQPPAGLECLMIPSLDDLLRDADVVTLHVPGGADTRHLLDEGRLGLMKKGAILINTARGDLVDEAALAQAVESGWLGGAGIDVFEQEPYTGPLAKLETVVMTAHMGSYAAETREKMEADAVENLITGLRKKKAI